MTMIQFGQRPLNKQRDAKITSLLVNMIVGDMRPVNMVHGTNFTKLMGYIEPNYKIPSRQFFTREIEARYVNCKLKLIDFLKSVENKALTMDTWSSPKMESYIGITCHFWAGRDIKSYVLATCQVIDSHTGENIASWICTSMEVFAIPPSKVVAVVTDNGANVISAIRVLKEKYEWCLHHIRCAAHTLQLCIKDCLSETSIKRAIGAARHLVQHFRHSPKAMDEIRKRYTANREPDTPPTIELSMDCTTRWNSTHDMLKNLCNHQWVIRQYLQTLPISKAATLEMKDEYWQICQKLVKLLEDLKTATTALEGEKYVTISCLIPMVRGLHKIYRPTQDGTFQNKFKEAFISSLKTRFDSNVAHDIYKLATFLDPNYRSRFSTRSEIAQIKVKLEMEDMGHDQAGSCETVTPTPTPVCDEPNAKSSFSDILESGQVSDGSDDSSPNNEDLILGQINWYIQKKIGGNAIPIEWWSGNRTEAEYLFALAKKYLCIPATSAPAERVFSSAGLTIGKLRTRKHVEALNFLHCNQDLL
ncbi:E3 SUMO-protein ligase ZBED1-like isoform X1 [Styela clava]